MTGRRRRPAADSDPAPVDGLEARAIGPRIRTLLPTLTPLESSVVDLVLGHRDFDESTPLKAVADEAGVSEAMIVKVAKKLGFSGFRDFRAGLAEYNRLPIAEMHREVSPDDPAAEVVAKVFHTSIQALQETLAILDVESFELAADLLARAREREFYGLGASAQVARDMSHKLMRIGIRASVHDDAHRMLMSAALLGADDVAVAFSHSGTTAAVIDALQLARRNGARTVAVTAAAASPLTRHADVVLLSTARGSPLLGETAAARIAQLAIMDALFVAVAQRDYTAAERNLARTVNAVRPKRRPG